MKRLSLLTFVTLSLIATNGHAQKLKNTEVPDAVKSALSKQFPAAGNVTWEKEKGNFEANWGGKSKEDNSVLFTPAGEFVEKVVAIQVAELPIGIMTYVRDHYPGAKISEAGKVTDSKGKVSYEAEVKGKDLLFDREGNFIKKD